MSLCRNTYKVGRSLTKGGRGSYKSLATSTPRSFTLHSSNHRLPDPVLPIATYPKFQELLENWNQQPRFKPRKPRDFPTEKQPKFFTPHSSPFTLHNFSPLVPPEWTTGFNHHRIGVGSCCHFRDDPVAKVARPWDINGANGQSAQCLATLATKLSMGNRSQPGKTDVRHGHGTVKSSMLVTGEGRRRTASSRVPQCSGQPDALKKLRSCPKSC